MIITTTRAHYEIFKLQKEKKIQPGHFRKRYCGFFKKLILCLAVLSFVQAGGQTSSKNGWYAAGSFVPQHRIKITVTNSLKIQLKDQLVIVDRSQLPF